MNKGILTDKEYLKIAIPFILSTVTQPLLGAIDTAVVGHLDNYAYIASVSICAVIFNTIYWMFGFLRVSTTGFSAQARGLDNIMIAFFRPVVVAVVVALLLLVFRNHIFSMSMIIISPQLQVHNFAAIYFDILIWGAPFVLINYVILGWLMGQMKIKASLFMQISGNILNIVLDIIFVYGFHMSIEGVAYATLISQITSTVLGTLFMFRYGSFTKMEWKNIYNQREFLNMLKVNADLIIRTSCLLIQTNIFTATSAAYGTIILSANAVLLQITSVISYIFDGLANASSVYAGNAIGTGNVALLKETWKKNTKWTVVLMVITTSIYLILNEYIITLFTNITQVLIVVKEYRLWVALYPLLAGMGLSFYGVFTGTSVTKVVRNSTFFGLIVFILIKWVSIPKYFNHGLWLSLLAFYFARTLFLLPYLNQTALAVTEKEIKK